MGVLGSEGETEGRKVKVHLLTSPEPSDITPQHGGPPAGRRAAWLAEAPDSPHNSGCAAIHVTTWTEPEELSCCPPPAFWSRSHTR